jgi:hypothetical protein
LLQAQWGVNKLANRVFTPAFVASRETSRNKKETPQGYFEPLCNIFFTRGGGRSAAETGSKTGLQNPREKLTRQPPKPLETSKCKNV